MKCKWHDCFTCPYGDCIKDTKTQDNPKTHKRYYERHKAERLAYQKNYNEAHKADRHEQFQKRWANMTEEEKEKQRARQREAYKRKKCNVK